MSFAAVLFVRINPFRTGVPFWGQITRILSSLSPKRDYDPKRVIPDLVLIQMDKYIENSMPITTSTPRST